MKIWCGLTEAKGLTLSRLILRQGPSGHRFAAGIEDRSDPLGVGFA